MGYRYFTNVTKVRYVFLTKIQNRQTVKVLSESNIVVPHQNEDFKDSNS